MIQTINLAEKFSHFAAHFQPKIIGEVENCQIKLVKFQGEFVWHSHANEDEMFLVVKGRFTMRLRDGDQTIGEGECIIIPKGVEHCPVAEQEVHILLVEPGTTLNTGDARSDKTVTDLERI